jgi:hypothetical protein
MTAEDAARPSNDSRFVRGCEPSRGKGSAPAISRLNNLILGRHSITCHSANPLPRSPGSKIRISLDTCGQTERRQRTAMPILPLDSPEPFAATLGVMLYPGTDKSDQAKARAFAARWLAEPLRRSLGVSCPMMLCDGLLKAAARRLVNSRRGGRAELQPANCSRRFIF